MSKKPTFFDAMKIVLEKKPYPSDEFIEQSVSQWMMNQYFSCNQALSELALQLSKLKMSNKEYFDICYYGIPKMNSFIKYNAKKTQKEQNVKYIMDYYHCNHNDAKVYVNLISEAEMADIISYNEDRGIKK